VLVFDLRAAFDIVNHSYTSWQARKL